MDPDKLNAQNKRAAARRASASEVRARLKEASATAAEARASNPLFRCPKPEEFPRPNFPQEAMRLGFAVKVIGKPGLKSNDSRRWQHNPHLRVSLGYLCEIFEYLRQHDIHMYRMSSDLAPYNTHPDMPRFHQMIKESRGELATVGRIARAQDLRLSFHPSQYIVLNSEYEQLTQKSIADLESQAEVLDLMECGPEAVVVVHVGGAYGDRPNGWKRWCTTWNRLSERVKRRLALENDDVRFSAADVLSIYERTGVRCVFDYQHHWCFNPEGLPLVPTMEWFLRTWPGGARPKIHFSCARTEMRELKRKNRKTGLMEAVLLAPVWTDSLPAVDFPSRHGCNARIQGQGPFTVAPARGYRTLRPRSGASLRNFRRSRLR